MSDFEFDIADDGTDDVRLLHRLHVLPYFDRLWEVIAPACRLCIEGGSLRRRVELVKDLEMIALPFFDSTGNMFAGGKLVYSRLDAVLRDLVDRRKLSWDTKVKRNGDRYKRFRVPGIDVAFELFLCDATNRGYIEMVRTGPADFTHAMVAARSVGGLCPDHLVCHDGYVWHCGADRIPTAIAPMGNEWELFEAWGLRWVPPSKRTPRTVSFARRYLGLPNIPLTRVHKTAPSHDPLEAYA